MNMIAAQRRVFAKAAFSTDRLGETIIYNGREITALVEVGASLARTDWNISHTTTEEARLGDLAVFSVLDTDFPDEPPQEGDEIIYHNDSYTVSRVDNHDEAGANYVIDAMRNGRAMGR